jgi:6,7-dimethyl-8-ribityllumazine synthase
VTDAPRILLVEARFYDDIADQLVAGATAAVEERGGSCARIAVPGAMEIPLVVRYAVDAAAAGTGSAFDGFVALGCVIRGETTHYDHVCQESIGGLHKLALRYSLAIGTGILTCEDRDQAWARAAVDQGNKGAAAANAALDLIAVRQSFRAGQ